MAIDTLRPGENVSTTIRESEVKTTEGNAAPAVYTEDAVATLVWGNFQRAKAYLEKNDWLLEWQETDILYQSPIPNRTKRREDGRPPRVPRFLVAKFSRTLARGMRRALFSDQYPFFFRPGDQASQEICDAWSALIGVLLERSKFKYQAGGLQINCQTLQGTGLGKFGWEERQIYKRGRRRKKPAEKVEMPTGEAKEVPTEESDTFEPYTDKITESWPFYEYRRLGSTLFDPKWCTPDFPDESAGYCVDVDYVDFFDLEQMAQLSCYQSSENNPGIPSTEALKNFFFQNPTGNAPVGSNVEDVMSSQGSMVVHAEGRNIQTDISPLKKPIMLLEQWDDRTVKTILVLNDRKLVIRNEQHDQGSMSHTSATWWPIDNSGYGMGIGRINGADQRINTGVINAALKMIAFPLNAPILTARGENAPTQNVIANLGTFLQVDAPGGDINKAIGFMKMPDVPADAWRFLDISQRGGEEISGADAQMQQGTPVGRQGATRSSFGAQRVASASDQNIADPVESFAEGVVIPFVKFLIHMVKTKMPLKEIRQILKPEHAAIIQKEIDLDRFLNAEFEIKVLAGQKLAARAAIQQLLPFFLQIVQQPQLLQFLHDRGETVDFKVIMDLLLQVSELAQQPDIFRALTPRERVMVTRMNAGVQRIQGDLMKEKAKGAEKSRHIREQGEVDLGNKAAEIAMEHEANGTPLIRATGLMERSADANILRGGLDNPLEQ